MCRIAFPAIVTFLGCTSGPPAADEANVVAASEVKAPPAATPPIHAAESVMPGAPPQAAARIEPPSGAQYSGHFANKNVTKLQRNTLQGHASSWSARASLSPTYAAKQSDYLRKWREAESTMATLTPEERDVRRADLKREILGE
jgi:hypothetical protein